MIKLEQIQLLESKTNKAVDLIKALKEENHSLKKTIETFQNRIQQLENLIGEFKSDQEEIEKGILKALTKLGQLETEVSESAQPNSQTQQPQETQEIKAKEAGKQESITPETEPPQVYTSNQGGKEGELDIF